MTSKNETTAYPAKMVRCPTCGGNSVYAPTNDSRPFCSVRCKNIDLGAWASEDFRMSSDSPATDTLLPDDQQTH